MAIQYNNINKFVNPHGFKLVTKKEDYIILEQDKRVITFKCPSEHEITLVHAVFMNKKSKFTRENLPMIDFCSVCVELRNKKESEDRFKNEIEEETGHTIIELDNQTREVVYQCGTCGEKNHSFIQNMKVNTGVCHHCQNEQFKLKYEDVKQRVEEKGFVLLTKETEYKNNKQLLNVICTCGLDHIEILFDITRGKACNTCKQKRCKITCLEKYGEDNVSKVPHILSKIQYSNISRKNMILPITKRELVLMGYEPQAISFLLEQDKDSLLSRKIEEDDICVGKDVTRFRYYDDDGKEHIYFPDLQIRNTNIIIEVKSYYTFHYNVRTNYLKFKKVVQDGYILRLLMFNGYKMSLVDITCKTVDDVEQIMDL